MRSRLSIALLSSLLLGACAGKPPIEEAVAPVEQEQPSPRPAPTKADLARLDTLTGWMAGSFDNVEQARGDASYYDIRLHMTPIWATRPATDGRWLYVEQAMADQPAKPYRQRIYHLVALGGGRFRYDICELPPAGNAATFVGAWKTPESFDALSPTDLKPSEGCGVTLTDTKDGFVGGTHAQDCTSVAPGAVYTTCRVTVAPDILIAWDQGFNAEGKQVWGATKGGYIFRKRSR
jgi:hypothetical protein